MFRIRYILWTLLFAAACSCAAQGIGPTTQPAPIDGTAAVNAVNEIVAQANAAIGAANAQQASDAQTIAGLRQQQAAAQAQIAQLRQPPTQRPPRGWVCTNISSNNYYTNVVYTDVGRQCSGFYGVNSPNPFTYNAHGFPVGANIHARSQCYLIGLPAKTPIHVSWTGAAQLQFIFYGGGTFQANGANAGTITLPAVSAIDANGNPTQVLWIDVLNSPPGNPLDNLHLWLDGFGPDGANPNQLFRPDYVRTLANFAGMRLMPFMNAVNSTEVNVADRILPAVWDQTTRGPAWESAVELFKEVRAINPRMNRVWVTLPITASAPYQQFVVQMFHDALPAGCELIVERGNEPFNSSGPVAYKYVWNVANTTNPAKYDGTYSASGAWQPSPAAGPFVTDGLTRAVRANADLARDMSLAVRPIYADKPGDLTIVLGVQAQWDIWAKEGLKWEQAAYGDHPFDAIGDAPYFSWDSYTTPQKWLPATTQPALSDYSSAVQQFFTNYVAAWETDITAVARQYGVRHYNYEAGNSFWSQPFSRTMPSVVYCLSPEIGKDYDAYLYQLHDDDGVDAYFDFVHGPAEPWDQYGLWADLQSFDPNDPTGPGVNNFRWMSLQRACARWN